MATKNRNVDVLIENLTAFIEISIVLAGRSVGLRDHQRNLECIADPIEGRKSKRPRTEKDHAHRILLSGRVPGRMSPAGP